MIRQLARAMESASYEEYCNPQGCKIIAGGRRPPVKRASSASHPEGVLSPSCTLAGCGMIFLIGSGGLATTGYSLAALRAANFLANSILGYYRCLTRLDAGPAIGVGSVFFKTILRRHRMRKRVTPVLFLCLLVMLASSALSAGASGYHVSKTVKLGGEGGWDYLSVDSKARRVYISRGTHVMVVDADTGAVVGDIPNTNGVHGIAIASE